MPQVQHEIKAQKKLLDANGYVDEPGWCRRNLFEYNRENITAPAIRIKEWDFYQVSDGRYLVQMTITNISMGDGATIDVIDMLTGKQILSAMKVELMTVDKNPMPRNGDQPNTVQRDFKDFFHMKFDYDGKVRHLTASGTALIPAGKKFDIDLCLDVMPDLESITIALPWEQKDAPGAGKLKNRFFLTDKIDSMPVSGHVRVGNTDIEFDPEKAVGVLDWGRGVWAHDNHWVWANGGGYLPDGKMFGFELTWGFADDSHATETCIFYDGKAHKIGRVGIEYDPAHQDSTPWHFHEENGRFEMTMVPFYNKHSNINAGAIAMTSNQVHGKWSGTATLDDGTVLEIKDLNAFCEHVHNKW